ncbi:protein of unknown function [Taphrina deformans PYCC 5710]|uniref:acylphosphatase n=1 Tax=Taphrina deformans (strain PYCC 5710 / ATCC 11124 / CBS 356.35 / IMI 108563 / JCM 9778 / NBRC 8474) TaxID=1097556 RepID=R4X959_TAPDE|nr:protein of unknown function [Taphrina deformans PYCC 5710]|eukprot:CCG81960.1 protein of unknown function [Taphrina deformans PYCC 5710]
MPRIKYEVFGKVQGVGFRATTQDLAQHIGSLTGYVRNTDRDTVEGEAQGTSARLDKFISGLEKSPAGRVDRVERHDVDEVSGENSFTA